MKQDKELNRMMELAGMKPAKKTTSKKENLNESVVGIGAINSPFLQREKSDYELAFEHYMNEEANAKTSLIEDLEAENALLREIIEQHLTEGEIQKLINEGKEERLRQDFLLKAKVWKKKGTIRGLTQEMLDDLMKQAKEDGFNGKPGIDPKTKLMTYRPADEIKWGTLGLSKGKQMGQGG